MRDEASSEAAPSVVERVQGRLGELALRRAGPHFEIIANGVFLMDTRDGRSERLLARLALGHAPEGARLLIGGLGVGFTLAEALRSERLAEVTVVEIEPCVVAWGRTHLASFSGDALADPRVRVVVDDLPAWLGRTNETFDAIALDIDNGPTWTVAEANRGLYDLEGLSLTHSRLAPGGALAVWSAAADPGFEARLRLLFGAVETIPVPARRGEPDVVTVARLERV